MVEQKTSTCTPLSLRHSSPCAARRSPRDEIVHRAISPRLRKSDGFGMCRQPLTVRACPPPHVLDAERLLDHVFIDCWSASA